SRRIREADLWAMNADGGAQKQFMDDVYTDRYPSMTPDGRYIVFDSLGRGGGTHIWRMDADGGNVKQLTSGGAEQAPQVSPDGRASLFADDRNGAANSWSQPVAGGQPVQLTNFTSDNIYSFDLSRDGRQLALARGSVSSDVVVMSESK